MRAVGLVVPTSGARVPRRLADDHLERCRAVQLVVRGFSAVSHGSALRVLGVDLPGALGRDDRVHLTVGKAATIPRRQGVVTHQHSWTGRRFDRRELPCLQLDGLVVVRPAFAWVQLGPVLAVEDLVVVGDALTRRNGAHTSLAALRHFVATAPAGSRGIRRLRVALDLVRPGTDSVPETRLRLILVSLGLHPEVNAKVYDDAGRFVAMPDLVLRDLRLAIEYDGDVHRTDRRTWLRDVRKREALKEIGWETVVVTALDLRDRTELTARLTRILTRRRASAA